MSFVLFRHVTISHIKGKTQIEDVWEQGAHEDIVA